MAMTAPTPMIMPSAVSAERSLFRRRARNATLNVDPTLIFPVAAVYDRRNHAKSAVIGRRYKVWFIRAHPLPMLQVVPFRRPRCDALLLSAGKLTGMMFLAALQTD